MKKLTTILLLTFILVSLAAVSFDTVDAQTSVARVQGVVHAHASSTNSTTLTFSSTPTYGNIICLTVLLNTASGTVYTVTQSGVYWSKAINSSSASGSLDNEIWFGNVWSLSAGKTITLTTTVSVSGITADACEYSGTFALDKNAYSVGVFNNGNKTALPTGTTSLTENANEAFIGSIATTQGGTDQNSPGNSYSELDGHPEGSGTLSYLEYIANAQAATWSSESGYAILSTYNDYVGTIATFGASGLFNLGPSAGYSFTLNDTYQSTMLTVTVQSGTLTGVADFSTSSTVGRLQINATSTSTFRITQTGSANLYVNGVAYTAGSTIQVYSGTSVTVTWNSNVAPSPSVIVNPSFSYYFRSDSFTTLGVSAYGFDTDYTNSAYLYNVTQSGAVTLKYGFRIYLYSSATSQTELTSGSPQAVITLSANTTGNVAGTWTCPAETLTLGYQAFKIDLYQSVDGGANWVSVASFVSPVLIAESLQSSTWTLSLNVNYAQGTTDTTCTVAWGSSTYRSGINGITFTAAKESAINFWRLSNGDLIGFTFGSYIDLIGEGAFYILCLFAVFASLYRRYGHVGIIVVAFFLFAGPGSLLVLVLGSYAMWAAAAAIILLIVAGTFVIWRIIR